VTKPATVHFVLRADRTRRLVGSMLMDAGIDGLLLKGPTLQPMWGDEARPYNDVDVLVHPADHATVVQLLLDADFYARAALAPSPNATTLHRDGDAPVDLHHTLVTSGVDSATTVEVLRRGAERRTDGLLWPTEEVAACVAVLHAAQNLVGSWKPARDVGYVAADVGRVARAADIASDLQADHPWRVGLSSHPDGRQVASDLAISPPNRFRTVAWHLRGQLRLIPAVVRANGFVGLVRYVFGPPPERGELASHPRLLRWRRLIERLLRVNGI
jgi:hypothetical protein